MQKLWKVLNSPLIVVLVALLLWPIMTALSASFAIKMGVNDIVGSFKRPVDNLEKKQRKVAKDTIKVMDKVQIENIKVVSGNWKYQEKVIGTIKNSSTKTIKSIHLGLSSYDKNGELIDYSDRKQSNIQFISPGQEANFAIERRYGKQNDTAEELDNKRSHSVTVSLNHFTIMKYKE